MQANCGCFKVLKTFICFGVDLHDRGIVGIRAVKPELKFWAPAPGV